MSDTDDPIYVEMTVIGDDPLADYCETPYTQLDALLDQCRTIIQLQERIMSDQTELDAAVATLSAGIDKLEAREASESAAVPLDLSALNALAGRVDALDASGAARVPAPAAPAPVDAAPVIDPNTGQPVVPAA